MEMRKAIKLPHLMAERTLEERYFGEKLITRFNPNTLSSTDYLHDMKPQDAEIPADKYLIPCGFDYYWTRAKEGKFTEPDFLRFQCDNPLLQYIGSVHGRLLLGGAYVRDGYERIDLMPAVFAQRHAQFCAACKNCGIDMAQDFYIIENYLYQGWRSLDLCDRLINDLPRKFYTHANIQLGVLAVMITPQKDNEAEWYDRGFTHGYGSIMFKLIDKRRRCDP